MKRRYLLELVVGAVSIAFLAAAIGSLLLMVRQWGDLEVTVSSSAWSVAKTNEDYLDVLFEIERARASGSPDDLESATLSVDILWSRLDILVEGSEARLLREADLVQEMRRNLLLRLKQLEPFLATPESLRSAEAAQVIDGLIELRPVVTDVVRETMQYIMDVENPSHLLLYQKLGIALILCASGLGVILIGLLAREIGDHKRRQLELEKERNRAELANQSKSRFLATISHELRTPLNAIIGFSEAMRAEVFGTLTHQHKSYLGDIITSGKHLLSIVDDLLDVSKLSVGKVEILPDVFVVRDVLDETLALMTARKLARDVHIDTSYDDLGGAVEVRMDPRSLKQIVLNLVSNAVKFSHDGGRVLVAVTTRRGDLEVSVTDDGIGVPAQDIDRVFQMFEQVEDPFHRSNGGTGIGLPVSRSLAEMNGGTLTMTSTVGVGTTVTLHVPGAVVRRADVAA